ncbi:MAG: hypothetical protein AAFQ63_14125 [Cyanobacteria bacterium J06621_11]
MTLQQFYSFLYDTKLVLLFLMLFGPWIAWGICVAIPGKKEEPFVLSCNLGMATISLSLTVGYVWYLAHTAGLNQVVQDVDILLVLAPCYYVGVSLWVTRQRLPLSQVPAARALQGLALIGAGYLGLAWLFSKLRIVLFSFLPFPLIVFVVLALLAVGYMGYQRITGQDLQGENIRAKVPSKSSTSSPFSSASSIDDELEALRRDLDNDNNT